MIELAWLWVRHQPDSVLSGWFRKLLIALWRYVTQGEVPEGAVLKAA